LGGRLAEPLQLLIDGRLKLQLLIDGRLKYIEATIP